MDVLWNKFYNSGKIKDYLEYKKKQGGKKYGDNKGACIKGTPIR